MELADDSGPADSSLTLPDPSSSFNGAGGLPYQPPTLPGSGISNPVSGLFDAIKQKTPQELNDIGKGIIDLWSNQSQVPNDIGKSAQDLMPQNLNDQIKDTAGNAENWYDKQPISQLPNVAGNMGQDLGDWWNQINAPYGTTDPAKQQQMAQQNQQSQLQGGQQIGDFLLNAQKQGGNALGSFTNWIDSTSPDYTSQYGQQDAKKVTDTYNAVTYPMVGLANWFKDSRPEGSTAQFQQAAQNGDWKGMYNSVTDWLGTAENDIFDPQVLNPRLTAVFTDNGMNPKDAQNTSDALSGLVNTAVSFIGPAGKLAMLNFLMSTIEDPGKAIQGIGQGNQYFGDLIDAYVHGNGQILVRDKDGNTDGSRRSITGQDFGNASDAIINAFPLAYGALHFIGGKAQEGGTNAPTNTTEIAQDGTARNARTTGQGSPGSETQSSGQGFATNEIPKTGTSQGTPQIFDKISGQADVTENADQSLGNQSTAGTPADAAKTDQSIRQTPSESPISGQQPNAVDGTNFPKDFDPKTDPLIQGVQKARDAYKNAQNEFIKVENKEAARLGWTKDKFGRWNRSPRSTWSQEFLDAEETLSLFMENYDNAIDAETYRPERGLAPDEFGDTSGIDAQGNYIKGTGTSESLPPENGMSPEDFFKSVGRDADGNIEDSAKKQVDDLGGAGKLFNELTPERKARMHQVMGSEAVDASAANKRGLYNTEVQREYPKVVPQLPSNRPYVFPDKIPKSGDYVDARGQTEQAGANSWMPPVNDEEYQARKAKESAERQRILDDLKATDKTPTAEDIRKGELNTDERSRGITNGPLARAHSAMKDVEPTYHDDSEGGQWASRYQEGLRRIGKMVGFDGFGKISNTDGGRQLIEGTTLPPDRSIDQFWNTNLSNAVDRVITEIAGDDWAITDGLLDLDIQRAKDLLYDARINYVGLNPATSVDLALQEIEQRQYMRPGLDQVIKDHLDRVKVQLDTKKIDPKDQAEYFKVWQNKMAELIANANKEIDSLDTLINDPDMTDDKAAKAGWDLRDAHRFLDNMKQFQDHYQNIVDTLYPIHEELKKTTGVSGFTDSPFNIEKPEGAESNVGKIGSERVLQYKMDGIQKKLTDIDQQIKKLIGKNYYEFEDQLDSRGMAASDVLSGSKLTQYKMLSGRYDLLETQRSHLEMALEDTNAKARTPEQTANKKSLGKEMAQSAQHQDWYSYNYMLQAAQDFFGPKQPFKEWKQNIEDVIAKGNSEFRPEIYFANRPRERKLYESVIAEAVAKNTDPRDILVDRLNSEETKMRSRGFQTPLEARQPKWWKQINSPEARTPQGLDSKEANISTVWEAFNTPSAKMDNRIRQLYTQVKNVIDPYGILKQQINSMKYDVKVDWQAQAPFKVGEILVNIRRPNPEEIANELEQGLGTYIEPKHGVQAWQTAKQHINELRDIAKNPALGEFLILHEEADHQYDYVIYNLDRNSPTPWSDLVYNMIHDIPDEVLQNWAERGLDFEGLIGKSMKGLGLSEKNARLLGKDLIEMSVRQTALYKKLPASQYAWSIPEVYANDIRYPQKAIDGANLYGPFRDARIAAVFGTDKLRSTDTARSGDATASSAGNFRNQGAASDTSGVGKTVKLYHGTINKAIPGIQEKGLQASNPHSLINDVETILGLPIDSIWDKHYQKKFGEPDKNVLSFTSHPDTAAAYAKRFGEVFDEALNVAFQLTHTKDKYRSDMEPSKLKWKAEIASQLGLKPVVTEFEVPDEKLRKGWAENIRAGEYTPNIRINGDIGPEHFKRFVGIDNIDELLGDQKPADNMRDYPSPSDFQKPYPAASIPNFQRTAEGVKGLPPKLSDENNKVLDKFDHTNNAWMMASPKKLESLNQEFASITKDLSDHISANIDPQHTEVVNAALSFATDARNAINRELATAKGKKLGTLQKAALDMDKTLGQLTDLQKVVTERYQAPSVADMELPEQVAAGAFSEVPGKPEKPIAGLLPPKTAQTLAARLKLVNGMEVEDFINAVGEGNDDAIMDAFGHLGKQMQKQINDVIDQRKTGDVEGPAEIPIPKVPAKVLKAREVINQAALDSSQLAASNQYVDKIWLPRAQEIITKTGPSHPAYLAAQDLMVKRTLLSSAIARGVDPKRIGDLEQSVDLAASTLEKNMGGPGRQVTPASASTGPLKGALTDKQQKTANAVRIAKLDPQGNVQLDAKVIADAAGYTLDSAKDLLNGHVQHGFVIDNKTKQILKGTDPRVVGKSITPVTITGKAGVDFKWDSTAKEMRILNDAHVHLGYRSDIVKSWDDNFKTYMKGELRKGSVYMPQNLTPEQNTWRNGIEVKDQSGQPFRPKTQADKHIVANHIANLVDTGFFHSMAENPMTKSEVWKDWQDFGNGLAGLGLKRQKPPEIPDLIGQVSRADLMKRNKAMSRRAEEMIAFEKNLEQSGGDPFGLHRIDNSQPPGGGGPKDPTVTNGDFEEGPNRDIVNIWNESQDRFMNLANHGGDAKKLGNGLLFWMQHVMGMHDIYNFVGDARLAMSHQEGQYNAGSHIANNEITPALKKLFNPQVREQMFTALDVNDVPKEQRANERESRINALPTQEARDAAWAIASVHDFLGNILRARGVTETAVDYYISHIFKPDGKASTWAQDLKSQILHGESTSGPSSNAVSKFRQKRSVDTETGEYKYPTAASLEETFEKPVYKDIADTLNLHMNSALYSLSMKDFTNHLDFDYKDNATGYQAPTRISRKDVELNNLTDAIDTRQYREVKVGAYKKSMMNYLVRNEIADQMERFSGPFEGTGPGNILGRGLVRTNALWRGGSFISAFHSYSIHSLMAAKIAAEDGLVKGLMETATVLPIWRKSMKMTMDGHSILNNNPQYVSEKLIGLGGMKPPESLANVEGFEQSKSFWSKVPIAGTFYDWVWNKDIIPAQVGLAKYLDDSRRAELAKQPGFNPDDKAWQIQHYSQIVAEANRVTGLIPREDLPNWFKAFSKGALTGSEFTYTQASWLARAIPGSSSVPGLKGAFALRERVPVKGMDARVQKAMIKRANKLGSSALLYGVLGMGIMSEIENVISGYLSDGQPNNVWDNILDSPVHTLDIYHGTDDSGRRMYWHNPLFGAIEEIANYALAYEGGLQDGKSQGDAMRAAVSRMSGKIIPTVTAPFEALTNIELYKWIAGYKDSSGNPNYDVLPKPDRGMIQDPRTGAMIPDPNAGTGGDSALNQVSKLLDAINVPQGPGDLRDRLAFVLMNAVPKAGIPLTVPEAEGQGVWDVNQIKQNPTGFAQQAALGGALKLAGTSEQYGPPRFNGLTAQQQYAPQDAAKMQAASDQATLYAIASQPPSNDPKENANRIQQMAIIASRNGWSASKVTSIIQDQQKAADNAAFAGQQKQLVKNPAQRAANSIAAQQGAIRSDVIVAHGQSYTLSPEDSQSLNQSLVQRRLDVINLLNQDSNYRSLSAFDKANMQGTFNSLADQLTRQQMAQKLGYDTGALSDATVEEVLKQSLAERDRAAEIVMSTQGYQSADPAEQKKMVQTAQSLASTLVSDAYLKNAKGITPTTLPLILNDTLKTQSAVRMYVEKTPWFAESDPETQAQMLHNYDLVAAQMARNEIVNMSPQEAAFMAKNAGPESAQTFNTVALTMAVRNVVNTQEATIDLLHQQDFYRDADVNTQQSLDAKYIRLARNVAAYQSSGPSTGMVTDYKDIPTAFKYGLQSAIVGAIQGENAQYQVQQQFGGPDVIQGYAAQLAAIKKGYRESAGAVSSTTINRTEKNIEAAFLYQHPDYAAYLQAQAQFRKYDANYQLTSAINNSEYTKAATLSSAWNVYVGDPLMGAAGSITGDINSVDPSLQDPNSVQIDVSQIDPNDITGSLSAMGIDPNSVDPETLAAITGNN